MRVLLLGSPGTPGDPIERWHDDAYQGCLQIGWRTTFLRASQSVEDDIVAAARDADLFVWMRTYDYNIRGGDGNRMLRRIEEQGTPTAGVHFDLYWGLHGRQGRVGNEPWWTCQHIFTADGGQRDWTGRGVNHHWCPPPFGTRYLGLGRPSRKLVSYGAVFVGSNIRSIHGPHRSQLISWAHRTWGSQFRHLGARPSQRIYGQDLNAIFSAAGVVLGDSAPAPYYWSDRIPRALGRGAIFAHPHVEGMQSQGFTDEVMITYQLGEFYTIKQRLDGMGHTQREQMREAAVTLISERHLWRHRLEWIAGIACGS